MTMLKDTPGGAQLIERLVAASGDMGLAFAGEPSDRVHDHLDRALVTMQRGLAEELGATMAAKLVAALKRAVMLRKAQLERVPLGRA
jgi:hypothetical protein